MPTLFERIVSGELPCHKVWEDEHHLAFLDIQPRVEGHTLVIPKRAEDYLFDLGAEEHAALWNAAREVSAKLKAEFRCERVCVFVIGYEVPHAHIHLLPTSDLAQVPLPPLDVDAQARLAQTAARLAP
jgi:histidine triad (HIT) family protein